MPSNRMRSSMARILRVTAPLAGALALTCGADASAALSFPATADTRLSESSASSSYGTATLLRTDYAPSASAHSYVTFAVTDVGAVSTAKLRLFATGGGAGPSSTRSPTWRGARPP